MITKREFEYIKGLKKSFRDDEQIIFGPPPLTWSKEVIANDTKDTFLLDYRKGAIEIKKY